MFARGDYTIHRDNDMWCVRYTNARYDILREKRFYTMKDAIGYVDSKMGPR